MKRIITVILAIVLICSATFGVYAADVDEGVVGKTVISDGEWSYEKVNSYGYEIDAYIGSGIEAAVPYTFVKQYVTSIGDFAFNDNTVVISVTATPYITYVGNYAFDGCTALQSVKLYPSAATLGVGCFSGCTALTDVNLQDSAAAEVPAYCFADCVSLTVISLPDTCLSIGNYAFYNCSALARINIPDTVTEISDTAFTGCDSLIIYCTSDSYAHQYAEAKGIDYVLIDAAVEVTFILGDADGDGKITIMDATKVQRLLAELIEDPDGMIALRGDCGGNGLDILDATKIQRYLADLETDAEIGEVVTKEIFIS